MAALRTHYIKVLSRTSLLTIVKIAVWPSSMHHHHQHTKRYLQLAPSCSGYRSHGSRWQFMCKGGTQTPAHTRCTNDVRGLNQDAKWTQSCLSPDTSLPPNNFSISQHCDNALRPCMHSLNTLVCHLVYSSLPRRATFLTYPPHSTPLVYRSGMTVCSDLYAPLPY